MPMDAPGDLLEGDGQADSRLPHPPKGKRTVLTKYARHACAQCRKAKTRCEGGKPVCERCQKTGHECNWTLEDARRPLTRAHEQALKHQNALLRAEVDRLTREIENLRVQVSTGSASSNPPSVAGLSSPGLRDVSSSYAEHQHFVASGPSVQSDSPGPRSASAPGRSSGSAQEASPGADSPLWGIVPVEDIASDAQEDVNIADASHSDEDRRGPETEFDCDVESAYESDEDSDDSDVDVDKALVAPTKTLFSEQDDLHHYGLTSVFRLRRRDSRQSIRSQRHKAHDSAASGYDSVSSQGDARTVHRRSGQRSLRSILSSSSANETTGGPSARSGRSSRTQYRDNRSSSFLGFTSAQDAGTISDGKNKRDRKGKRRQPYSYPGGALHTRTSSPVRTQKHILLVGDLEDEPTTVWKGCECQSDCWNRWLPKGVPLSRREHDIILDRMFIFFTSWCMRLIPEYFLRDMYTFLHPSQSLPGHVLHNKVYSLGPSALTHSRLSTSLPRLAHYSPFLHNMLLAVGTAFSTDPEIRKPETRARFADEGKAYIEEECSRPNISTVQALGLLASYYSGQGQQTLGFTYFGMSIRIAQALGLFADCTPLLRAGRLRPRQVFDRTWCYHMAAANDACWSLYVGRECGIPLPPAASTKRQTPGNNNQANNGSTSDLGNLGKPASASVKDLQRAFSMDDPFCLSMIAGGGVGESLDQMTWRMRGMPDSGSNNSSVPQCKTFTTFMWGCQLMKIGRSVMDLMNRLASSDSATEIKLLIADIDIQLDAWRQDLPAELKLTPANEMTAPPHKLMLHTAFWWQHILLHRPFYQRNRSKSMDSLFSVARCNVAAREIINILRLWSKIYGTVRYCPITLIQTIFAAGTIYILQAMQAASGRRPAIQSQASALDNLEELVGYLREVSESWEAATRIADIFEKLLKEQRSGMLSGASVGGLRKKGSKKRRKLETLRENESAVHAAQETSADGDRALAPLRSLSDVKTDDGGEMSSPAIQSSATNPAFHQHGLSSSGSQQAFFPPSLQSYPTAGISPIFTSPTGDTAPLSFAYKQESQNSNDPAITTSPDMQEFPGANIPSYPTGYLSDESYLSDAGPAYMNIEDFSFLFPHSVADASTSPSQPTSSFMPSADLSFLFNTDTEVNMDVIMPGLSLFDPTGLTSGVGGASSSQASPTELGSDNPTGAGLDVYADAIASDVDLGGLVNASTGVRTRDDTVLDPRSGMGAHTPCVANGTVVLDDRTRALYDMLAALNYQQQF
ncbi:hypothetical protein ACEPAH_1402 [Sanghuangporus vaninii]